MAIFRGASLVIPDSYSGNFARLRGVRLFFIVEQILQKDKFETLNRKMVYKKF